MNRVGLIAQLELIERLIEEHRKRREWLIAEIWPVGSHARYRHGDHWRRVTIEDHSEHWWSSPRVLVQGPSGTRYWIDASRLEGYPK